MTPDPNELSSKINESLKRIAEKDPHYVNLFLLIEKTFGNISQSIDHRFESCDDHQRELFTQLAHTINDSVANLAQVIIATHNKLNKD